MLTATRKKNKIRKVEKTRTALKQVKKKEANKTRRWCWWHITTTNRPSTTTAGNFQVISHQRGNFLRDNRKEKNAKLNKKQATPITSHMPPPKGKKNCMQKEEKIQMCTDLRNIRDATELPRSSSTQHFAANFNN
ncbi:unnamed protein product [Ceratitis capitata]|uniref:(Mediterranean fruit fly) hypothetical protein n=1 Tax=Ceratitis capitata TaxID=7213 RepID=A0A811UMX3_CERCA|nr:unnamed protein product [Ceratitis capitata]